MSGNDPNDDELEREAAADRPLSIGGTRGHAPRLGTESRAINPRAQLQAEAEGQSRDYLPPQGHAPAGGPVREVYREEMRQRSTLPRGMPRVVPFPPRPAPPAPPERYIPLEQQLEMKAWDAYASAAMVAGYQPEQATQVADLMLEERQRRFGA